MLKGKVVVITGGAGLLGRTFCKAIVDSGGIAIIADRNLEAAEKLASELNGKSSTSSLAMPLDITDADSISKLIAAVKTKYGRIDALVNNAYPRNKNYGRRFEEVTYADFCENVGMHLGGYFLVAQQFCIYFREQGYGNVVNMASIYGVIAPRFEVYDGTTMTMPVEYAAIKSGIIQLTRYLSRYFRGGNIRVNCMSPGGILAGQPASFLNQYNSRCNTKGMLDPTDVAGTLVYLLSDHSKHVTAQNIVIDDGFCL